MKDYPRLDESISFLFSLLIQMFFIISKAIYFAHSLAIFDWITLKKNHIASKKEKVSVKLYREYCEYFRCPFFLETRAYLIKNICAIQNLNLVRNLMI